MILRIRNVIIILLLAFSVLWSQWSNNLVSNYSFETFTGTADDQSNDSWTDWNLVINGGYADASTESYDGLYSVHFYFNGTAANLYSSNIPVVNNTRYRIDFYGKVENGLLCQYAVRKSDLSSYYISWTSFYGTGQYEHITDYFTTDNSGVSVYIRIGAPGNLTERNAYYDKVILRQELDTLWVLSTGSDTDDDSVKTLTEAFVNRGTHAGGIFIIEARNYGESITIDSSFNEIILSGSGKFKTTSIDFNNVSCIVPYDVWIGTSYKSNYDNVTIKIDANTFLKYKKKRGWAKW